MARELLGRHAGHRSLLESTSKELLALYGIPITEAVLVQSPDEAVAAAEKIEGPVALKVMSYDLPHKTEYGAVRLGLHGADAVRVGFEEMLAEVATKAPDAVQDGVLVQQMVPARFELTAGIHDDPVFGPTVVLGLGGILIEILSETAMLRPPFTFQTAQQALSGLLGGRLVEGGRGLSDTEQQAVAAIMVALGQLALEGARGDRGRRQSHPGGRWCRLCGRRPGGRGPAVVSAESAELADAVRRVSDELAVATGHGQLRPGDRPAQLGPGPVVFSPPTPTSTGPRSRARSMPTWTSSVPGWSTSRLPSTSSGTSSGSSTGTRDSPRPTDRPALRRRRR